MIFSGRTMLNSHIRQRGQRHGPHIFAAGQGTVFGGLGDDIIVTGNDAGRDMLQGNEGNDTIEAFGASIPFERQRRRPVLLLRFQRRREQCDRRRPGGAYHRLGVRGRHARHARAGDFAADVGAGTGASLAASAGNAIAAAVALSGNPAAVVAAQFTFGGRTYLAIDQANAGFNDTDDLLFDITGASGNIAAARFLAHPPHHI